MVGRDIDYLSVHFSMRAYVTDLKVPPIIDLVGIRLCATVYPSLCCRSAMAPMPAPGIDLHNLSSNWKKLQKTLKEAESAEPRKRKRIEESVPPHANTTKRPKKTTNQPVPHSQMNHMLSDDGTGDKLERVLQPQAPSASIALWAADNDIPAKDIAAAYGTSLDSSVLPSAGGQMQRVNGGLSTGVEAGKFIALDCEMVGVGPDPENGSVLARVSIVNYHGHQLYDSFVQPKEKVTDYRTFVSGVTPELLKEARSLEDVQKDVDKLLTGKILVGHSLRHDLDALLLSHPKRDMRDTSKYPDFRQLAKGRTPGLKKLAKELLGVDIQSGEHSSIEDARAAMLLFRKEKEGFERDHRAKWGPDRRADETNSNGGHKKTRKWKKKGKKK